MIFYQLLAILLVATVNAIPIEDFFPFNGDKVCLIDATTGLIHTSNTLDGSGIPSSDLNPSDCDEFRLSPNDDASSQNIDISISFPFFNKRFRNIFINTNGVISFTAQVPTFTPEPFPINDRFLIAPYWADVDTRGTGEVYFKEVTEDDTISNALFPKADDIIQSSTTQSRGLSRFRPTWMLIATWHEVGYFSSHTDKTNTFQAILVTNRRHSFAIFNYLDDGINWNKGDASTVAAQVGFNFGQPGRIRKFTFNDSRTEEITDIDTKSNLKNKTGQFLYRIDQNPSDDEGCGANVTVDPETPSIINGGVMFLIGPCFNTDNIENITCLFTDNEGDVTEYKIMSRIIKRTIRGITKDGKAICPMPLFRTLGEHKLTIFIKDGTNYSGTFEVVSAHHKEPEVHIIYEDQEREFSIIQYNKVYTARWNVQQLNRDQFNEGGDISYMLQNWHWFDRPDVKRWRNRQSTTVFDVSNKNYSGGVVTFTQKRSHFSDNNFDLSLLVLNKCTKHLSILYTSTLFTFMSNVAQGQMTNEGAVMQYCNSWLPTMHNVSSSVLVSCPCNLQSLRGDPEFNIDDTCPSSNPQLKCYENVGAEKCFVKQISGTTMGQQCCYDADGSFTRSKRRLESNAAPAGSADLYFPFHSYLRHQYADYFPYRACCIEASDMSYCEQYYIKRPIDNSTNDAVNTGCTRTVENRGTAVGNGDPHFITLDGKQYTFNGLGEYILLSANNSEFVIQIQTKQAVNQARVAIKATVISVIAMKQKDKPTVQVQLDEIDGIEVLVESNTSDGGFRRLDFEFAPSRLFDGGRVGSEDEFSRVFTFELGFVVIAKAANDILSFQLSIPENFFNNTKGLLGVWNGNPEDDFLRPDGTRISVNSSESVIFEEFGEKWRADESNVFLIFEEGVPTSTQDSIYVPLFETPSVDATTAALIEETCGDNSECAYDIAVTGNVDVGRETLDDIEEHMMIINLTLPILCDPPCQNNAPCVANDTCSCDVGYTGKACETEIIQCNTTCQNGGTCIGLEICSCPKDYYGQYCNVFNPCLLNPCDQQCEIVGNDTYICGCTDGYILAANNISCIKCAKAKRSQVIKPTWHVALCNASNDDTICSGTAISDQWVLTSARCACNNGSGINKQSLSIRFGKNQTCSYAEPNELQLSASEIYCYPEYTTDALSVDIAAIKLESPIPVNVMKQSPPLCIGNARKGKELFFSKGNVEIFGWGKVGRVVDKEATLQSSGNVAVDVVMECRETFRKERVKDRSNRGIMCTIANTTSACTGNYGSAVVARDKNTIYFGAIVSRMTSVCGDTDSYLAHSKLFTKTAFQWVVSTTQS